MVLNQSWHASTNTSPSKLFFGREMMTPTKMLLPKPPAPQTPHGTYQEQMEERMQRVWQAARDYLGISKAAQKHYYDSNLVLADIDVGDRVYKFTPRGKAGLATKLMPHWLGPFIVTKVNETNAWIRPIAQPFVESQCIHLNMLKKYRGTNVPPEPEELHAELDDIPEPADSIDVNETESDTEIGATQHAEFIDPDATGEDIQEREIATEESPEVRKRRNKPKRLDPTFIYY